MPTRPAGQGTLIGGSLDVANTLSITSAGDLGVETGAWVAVMGPIKVKAPLNIDGWLVAPKADLGLDNTLQLRGAAYVGSLRVASPMTVSSGPSISGEGCVMP